MADLSASSGAGAVLRGLALLVGLLPAGLLPAAPAWGQGGTVRLNLVPPDQDTAYAAGGLANGILLAPGNRVSYCPVLSCVVSPSADHQRTSALFWATTGDDGHSEEQTVAIQTIINKGASRDWAPGTAYAVGDNVEFSGARNAVYRATVAGTSAGSGAGPVGKGADIADGSVRWAWVNDAAINGKVGLYNEAQVLPGAGKSWGQANNVHLMPGVVPRFNVNTELDFFNHAADCVPGAADCNALEISMGGEHRSSTGIHLSSPNAGPGYAALWGIRLHGDHLASDAAIEVTTTSRVGLGFGTAGVGTARHAVASILDQGTSPTSLMIAGSHAAQSIGDLSRSPAALNLSGHYGLAAIRTADADTPAALVARAGQKVCFAGTHACQWYDPAAGRWYWTDEDDVVVMSLARGTGNLVVKGSVTQNGVP